MFIVFPWFFLEKVIKMIADFFSVQELKHSNLLESVIARAMLQLHRFEDVCHASTQIFWLR